MELVWFVYFVSMVVHLLMIMESLVTMNWVDFVWFWLIYVLVSMVEHPSASGHYMPNIQQYNNKNTKSFIIVILILLNVISNASHTFVGLLFRLRLLRVYQVCILLWLIWLFVCMGFRHMRTCKYCSLNCHHSIWMISQNLQPCECKMLTLCFGTPKVSMWIYNCSVWRVQFAKLW